MKYLNLLFIMALLSPLAASAQTFKPGYIVTKNGDTIKGYVGFRRLRKNPEEIFFKRSPIQAKKDTFDVTTATAFYADGIGTFRAFTATLTQDLPDDPDIRIGKDTTTITKMVFLKLISTGKNLQLYTYSDKLKDRYLVCRQGGAPYELIYHEFHNPDRQLDPAVDATYRVQLQKLRSILHPEDLALIDTIQLAGYTYDDLCKIVTELNR